MSAININEILGKISELRAVFVLGQRAIPFLEEVFVFLKEISPLLDDINTSIRDTTYKMPRATGTLTSVSQATELATTEILDLIDAVLLKLGASRSHVDQAGHHLEAIGRADTRLIRLLRTELQGQDDLLAQVERIHEEKLALRRSVAASLKDKTEAVDQIRDKMNRIMISLQVQDITTQQIASVNHLIESIRDRLSVLIDRLNRGEIDPRGAFDDLQAGDRVTFDANARYDHSPERQQDADAVIAAFATGTPPEDGPASQDDIDALFGGGGTKPSAPEPADAGPASEDDINALFGAVGKSPTSSGDGAAASQDDIDALFGASAHKTAAPAEDGPASQDDIDALFGGR